VLGFGDSLLKFGLLPAVVERRTGLPTYNLSVNAGRPPGSYFLLRRALQAGARPRAIAIDYEPNVLSEPPTLNPECWAELADVGDSLELAWAAGEPRLLAKLLLARFFPSARYRFEIRRAVVARLQAQPAPTRDDIPALLRNAEHNRGALVMPHADRPPVRVEPPNRILFPEHWRCDPLNRRYVRKFLDLASRHQIRVFWVVAPYPPAIQAERERLGQDAAYSRFVDVLCTRSPWVTVLDARRSGYPHTVFWDGIAHLDVQGGTRLSEGVATAVAASLAGKRGPGWVMLPGYDGHPAGETVEDLDISRLALGAATAARR
jgi:hypothetical protein